MRVTAAVIEQAIADGVSRKPRLDGLDLTGLETYARDRFWEPEYLPFVKGETVL